MCDDDIGYAETSRAVGYVVDTFSENFRHVCLIQIRVDLAVSLTEVARTQSAIQNNIPIVAHLVQ